MSYLSAVQSALFYYLACTPCYACVGNHKAAKQAKKEREMKAQIILEQPHLYRHPDPFQTNPYWEEEIKMGPSLPKKGKNIDRSSKSLSQRRLTAASRDGGASIGAGSSVMFNMGSPTSTVGPRPSVSTTIAPTVVGDAEMASPTLSKTISVSTADDWNLKPYQREDEELWGHEYESQRRTQKLVDALKQAGSSAGRFVESKLGLEKQVTEQDRYDFYFAPKNPPVNEYHPPVVSSKPAHKDGLRWMLQPPPPAKVMEGKVPVSRSASLMSVNSRRTVSTVGSGSLGRLVGEKALEAKSRRGETPFDDRLSSASLARTRSRRTTVSTVRTRSRRTTRATSFSTESDDSSDDLHHRMARRRNHRPVATPEVDSDDEKEYNTKSIEAGISVTPPMPTHPTHAAQKPRLATILSSAVVDQVPSSQKTSSSPLQEVTNSTTTVTNSRSTESSGKITA
ncbi:uncharacterized protein PODANS_1_11980 [Podospora anserina S mat+]|uniref:Podospora anserina S mat+ genomic DNA chromosome 1, supercontig 2 n=2 Tax=Podospora TaxID=5144 RepID=B2AYR5_PODAN|nr:uncharacterized protein PODANS_1_11980 [Podospora anserina S mat+]CAP69539.1 unnamed protein product [Podospora anserina S mat+]CDP23556.1 Putative protein of unknown function [Podospora anserina S mat+]VBB72669.1 Putative protein of unknown function [Podospora comata]